jgi:hypothetical protein
MANKLSFYQRVFSSKNQDPNFLKSILSGLGSRRDYSVSSRVYSISDVITVMSLDVHYSLMPTDLDHCNVNVLDGFDALRDGDVRVFGDFRGSTSGLDD